MNKDFKPIEKENSPPELKEADQDKTLVNQPQDTGPTEAIALDDDSLLGSTLGGTIVIHEMLGKGGMSTVYKGWQSQIERPVAVKVMHSHLIEEKQALLRFQKEARAVGKLDHPNIVKVNDFKAGENGLSYLVMDYVEGRDLQELIKEEGPLDPKRAISIFSQALDAFEHAHKNGVVHRDIKPSNLMIVEDGEEEKVKILDFGIAKVVQDELTRDQRLTKTGEVFGSPLYMSPEQCMGKELDHRSDIYSMGCLIYEALASMPPLEGANVFETFFKHTTEMPEPLAKLRKDLEEARELDAIILKAMAKDPDKRYQSMADLKADLEKLIRKNDSTGLLSRARGEVEYLKRRESARKNSHGHLIAGLALAASLAILGLSFYFMTPTDTQSTTWKESYVEGQKSFDQGNYEAARKTLTHSLDMAGKDRTRAIPSLIELIDLQRATGELENNTYEKMLVQYRGDIVDEIFKNLTRLDKELAPLKEERQIDKTVHAINEQALLVIEHYPENRARVKPFLENALDKMEKSGIEKTRAHNRTIHNLGFLAYLTGNIKEAERLLEKARVQGEDLFNREPTTASTYLNTLDTYFHVLTSSGKLDKAERILEKRLDISERFRNDDNLGKSKSNSAIAKSKQKLAVFNLYNKADLDKARDFARSSLVHYENMQDPPALERANSLAILARVEMRQNNRKDAEENFLGARDLFESLRYQNSPYFVETLMSLGDIYMTGAKPEKAEPYYRRAVVVGLRQVPQHRSAVEESLRKLENLIYRKGQTQIASARIENPETFEKLQSLENLKLFSDLKMHGEKSAYVASDYESLAKLVRLSGDLTRADQYLEDARNIYKNLPEPNQVKNLEILVDRANLAFDRKKNELARSLLLEGIDLVKENQESFQHRQDILKKLSFSLEHRLGRKDLAESLSDSANNR